MKRADLVLNLERLGYALVKPKTHKVKNYQVLELLDELIDSEDPRLVEGFPVVLANCTYEDLGTLFAPKQKQIVLKKYNGETLNKTEQEYYSRKVKKKLEAMANSEVKKVIAALTKK